MNLSFIDEDQRRAYDAVLRGLRTLGYSGNLLVENYQFGDWFAPNVPERTVGAAAFGQWPPSYESACFGVVLANHCQGRDLIQTHRSLGAPLALEVRSGKVIQWAVGTTNDSTRELGVFAIEGLDAAFAEHATDWQPNQLLRAKNISFRGARQQLSLFDDDLLPQLESRIRDILDPIMHDACAAAIAQYRKATSRDPREDHLFRLAFWLLAGKVFRDRQIRHFADLSADSDPDVIIDRIAAYYKQPIPQPLTHAARVAARERIWSSLDFRNLSVDVLTGIWANTFVTAGLRKRLGIHSTPRSVARYVVERLPFEEIAEEDRIVLEPCCGSGVFLASAMQRLRELLPPSTTAGQRHQYFRHRLIGFEKDPVGTEIARLCLTLADFPNPNGWKLFTQDVFDSVAFIERLRDARIVLCNPPFEDMTEGERRAANAATVSRPAEILLRVLSNLHPDGMLGFVLPHTALDGNAYVDVRSRLAARFRNIELVSLPPDRAFATARHPSALLLAHGRQTGARVHITHRRVSREKWPEFQRRCATDPEDTKIASLEQAQSSLAVPLLSRIWDYLKRYQTLGAVATVRRGLEWKLPLVKKEDGKERETGNRKRYVSKSARPGFARGLPPRAAPFYSFVSPPTEFLSVKKDDLRRGQEIVKLAESPSVIPKVILNAKRKSQGPWRLAAFADLDGLVYYQTFTGIFPHDPSLAVPLAALLNGPIANAFVATHEIRDNTNETFETIPVPTFSDKLRIDLESLVAEYRPLTESLQEGPLFRCAGGAVSTDAALIKKADILLRRIDALVLAAFDLPPRSERELLDFFAGSSRQVPFPFADYYDPGFEPCFSLHEYLSPEFSSDTAGELRKRFRPPSEVVLQSLQTAAEAFETDQ